MGESLLCLLRDNPHGVEQSCAKQQGKRGSDKAGRELFKRACATRGAIAEAKDAQLDKGNGADTAD